MTNDNSCHHRSGGYRAGDTRGKKVLQEKWHRPSDCKKTRHRYQGWTYVLVSDAPLFTKIGERGGGSYIITFLSKWPVACQKYRNTTIDPVRKKNVSAHIFYFVNKETILVILVSKSFRTWNNFETMVDSIFENHKKVYEIKNEIVSLYLTLRQNSDLCL